MKNYLILLKQHLIKKQNTYIKGSEAKQNSKIIDIANTLGLDFAMHNLEKTQNKSGNSYIIDDNNMIFLYPVNDARPTCPFAFYKQGKLIIHNQNVYSEITNLDEIILELVRIFNKSLDEGIVIDPYYFLLRLDDEIKENYKGKATLIITEKAIRNQKLNKENFEEANQYFINRFLDHFIGWNFGVSVNRNETLRNELELLNQKVIEKGIRKYAGPGFEVHGTDKESYHGLQHYYLPHNKQNVKSKIKK